MTTFVLILPQQYRRVEGYVNSSILCTDDSKLQKSSNVPGHMPGVAIDPKYLQVENSYGLGNSNLKINMEV